MTIPKSPKTLGFTLIELLVVISIISLLSSIVLSSLSSARAKARDAQRLSDIHQLQNAFALYRNDHNGEFPPVTSDTIYCLGINNGVDCWKDNRIRGPKPQGNQSLNNSLSPYIKIPIDPLPNRDFGNAYLYWEGTPLNACLDSMYKLNPGHYILYEPDNYPSSNILNYKKDCLNKGTVSCCGDNNGNLCDGPYYCVYNID